MTTTAMWKPPTRREYKPKAMDPGQVVIWWQPRTGEPTAERIGTIWSDGSMPNTWWVLPDDDMLNPVIVRRAGKTHRWKYPEGALFQSTEGDHWRISVRRAENVRARGIYPVIDETREVHYNGAYDYVDMGNGRSQYRPRMVPEHTVIWHADQDCPDAAGKARYDGDGHDARGYTTYGGSVWTPGELARVLMGLQQIGASPTPFCARCIMLDTGLRSQHSCASVTA